MARSSRPRHTRPDQTQRPIVEALRQVGCKVWDLSPIGGDCPDLIACRPSPHGPGWLIVCLEVKTQTGVLTEDQAALQETHPGLVRVVRSEAEALRLLGATVAGAGAEVG